MKSNLHDRLDRTDCRAVGKNNSVVSWAAAATENAAADETKTSLMDTNGNGGGGALKHAALTSRNSVGINDF